MKRIHLRAVEPEDVDLMFACDNDEDSRIWTDYTSPLSRRQLMDYALTYDADPYRSGQLRMVIDLIREDGVHTPIGLADLYDLNQGDGRAFVGIYIMPEYRGTGYARETLHRLADYCSSILGLRMLAAKISTRNTPALSLFSKCGYKEICILPAWHRLGHTYHDISLLVLMCKEAQ